MGILAPLIVTSDRPERLVFSTSLGTFKTALLFLFFSLVIAAMGIASQPLLTRGFPHDPLFGVWLPKLLPILSASTALLGLATMGFRQSVSLDAKSKTLTSRISVWGISIRNQIFAFDEIIGWKNQNVAPKRYRPEENLKGKPVGYWEIVLNTSSGDVVLDRAPKSEELIWLRDKMQAFIAQNK